MVTKGSVPSQSNLAAIQLLVMDFDGVMTDNRVLVDENGIESVWCHRGDGFGVALLRDSLEMVVVSTEANKVVAARCAKLKINCVQNSDKKLTVVRALADERSLGPNQIAYVGNDVNDSTCMKWVGLPIAVADAEKSVCDLAKWITINTGGHGAVREICDAFLHAKR